VSDAGLVTLEGDGPVSVVTLARPQKRNALTPALLAELVAVLERAHTGGARAIVLAGAGPVFCSGFDMKLVHAEAGALPALLAGLSACVRWMRACPAAVVIAAHGGAVAGGCALLAGGDVVITDGRARLGYPVVRLGISPAVTVPGLLGMAGPGPTRERTLDPELVDGRRALELGLVHRCVDEPGEALPAALEVARGLAMKPEPAFGATKALLASLGLGADAFGRGLEVSLGLAGSIDQRARVAALWTGGPGAPTNG
jgi:enoyl-CoA hydratase/carnithine racemase